MNHVQIDFNQPTGKIRPLHSVCCAPYRTGEGNDQKFIQQYFPEGHIPYCRLHDCCGIYGGRFFVDVPNIFPNFDADENDPASYDFYFTDEYITAIQKAGTEAYYRLGVTIDWASRKTDVGVPPDMKKWARICEHIIRHYNEGWANGFHYNLTYWEIWNEPENPGGKHGPCMWGGTKEEFFDLYRIASRHLKDCFPNLKVGGYGGCGFYSVTKQNPPAHEQFFTQYFLDFLEMVKKESCPLDFFSWHIYTDSIDMLLAHARFVRQTLDDNGFAETESHLNEWNVYSEGTGFEQKHTMVAGSFLAEALAHMQNGTDIDLAAYYCMSAQSIYNGFMDQNDWHTDPPWYTFVAFGRLYELGEAVRVKQEGGIAAVAARDNATCAVLLSNYRSEDDRVSVNFEGAPKNAVARLRVLTDQKLLQEELVISIPENGTLQLCLPQLTVLFIEIQA